MFAFFAHSRYLPCPECGVSLANEIADEHVCDRERRLDYQLLQLRGGISRFDADLAAYLASPQGRFEAWYAERTRLAA
jgi:hypothetical protein